MMTLIELAQLVKQMRSSQKNYFRTRDHSVLAVCRDWEGRVDQEVKAVLCPPESSLFSETEQG
jgi:hypothetical protein